VFHAFVPILFFYLLLNTHYLLSVPRVLCICIYFVFKCYYKIHITYC